MLILALAAVWQTPVLNAEWIAARSQVSRIQSGTVAEAEMALWELAHDWGRPGRRELAKLKAGLSESEVDLVRRIGEAEAASSPWAFEQSVVGPTVSSLAETLHKHLKVLPAGETVTIKSLKDWPKHRLETWAESCQTTPEVRCVLVLADFDPNADGREGLLFVPSQRQSFNVFSVFEGERSLVLGEFLTPKGGKEVTESEVRSILEGRYEIAPSSRRALWVGDLEVSPGR